MLRLRETMLVGDGGCLDANDVAAFLAGALGSVATRRLERHVARCLECRELLSALARERSLTNLSLAAAALDDSAPPLSLEDTALASGTIVDRYAILHRLGAGAMGVVYAARDRELNRQVALKLLRTDSLATDELAAWRERLLREARAMAQLTHPNVVAVHDVGRFGEQIFVAMELVEGQTLAQWLRDGPRPLDDVLAAFLDAGHGLAAAHDAGLVHRDFKPENVLVGRDGRVRVTDFGLARELMPSGAATQTARARAATRLTVTGALMGTPFFMSPEQLLSAPVDASCDQFSFCVSLWHALSGEHPFDIDGPGGLFAAVTEGRRRSRHERVPRWLLPLLLRGLSVAADARHPSLHALLAALARGRTRLRRRATAAMVVAAGLLVAGSVAYRPTRAPAFCRASAPLAGVWDRTRADGVRRAFAATGVPFAGAAAVEVARALDGYARAWSAVRSDACDASLVRGDQSAMLFELRATCLDVRREQLRALVDELQAADATTVARAPTAAQVLGALSRCSDAPALLAPVRPPATKLPAVAALRRELAAVTAARALGRASVVNERARTLARAAAALHYRPLEAEALAALGAIDDEVGDAAAAETALQESVWAAEAGGDDELAARVWIDLIDVMARQRGRVEATLALVPRVTALLERLGGGHDELAGALHVVMGRLLVGGGRAVAGEHELRAGVALLERRFGPDDVRVARAVAALGESREARQPGAGRDAFARALAIVRKVYGDAHPEVARAASRLAASVERAARGD
jgi:eukaryotic-like serine/threonine-protein kinase